MTSSSPRSPRSSSSWTTQLTTISAAPAAAAAAAAPAPAWPLSSPPCHPASCQGQSHFDFFLNLPFGIFSCIILEQYCNGKMLSTLLQTLLSSSKHRQSQGLKHICQTLMKRLMPTTTTTTTTTIDNNENTTFLQRKNKDEQEDGTDTRFSARGDYRLIESFSNRIKNDISMVIQDYYKYFNTKPVANNNNNQRAADSDDTKDQEEKSPRRHLNILCDSVRQISEFCAVLSFLEDDVGSHLRYNDCSQRTSVVNGDSDKVAGELPPTTRSRERKQRKAKNNMLVECPIWVGELFMDKRRSRKATTAITMKANVIITTPQGTWSQSLLQTWKKISGHFRQYQHFAFASSSSSSSRLVTIPTPHQFIPLPPLGRVRGCTPLDAHTVSIMAKHLYVRDEVAELQFNRPLMNVFFLSRKQALDRMKQFGTTSNSGDGDDGNNNETGLLDKRRRPKNTWPLDYVLRVRTRPKNDDDEEEELEKEKEEMGHGCVGEERNERQRKLGCDDNDHDRHSDYCLGSVAAQAAGESSTVSMQSCGNDFSSSLSVSSRTSWFQINYAGPNGGFPNTSQVGNDHDDDDDDELFAFIDGSYHDVDNDFNSGIIQGTDNHRTISLLAEELIYMMNTYQAYKMDGDGTVWD